jgi:hypothetical protein
MSRGHGSRQRAILAALKAHAETNPPMADFDNDGQLLAASYGFENAHGLRDVPKSFLTADDLTTEPTPAALESTKRAIRKLKAAGNVETCHGRNHKLGARLTPDDDTRDRWRLALEDHQYVEWLIDYHQTRLAKARADLRNAFQDWDAEAAQRGIDYHAARASMSHRQVRESDDNLPSKRRERERERERRTADQKADDHLRAGELIAGMHNALGTATPAPPPTRPDAPTGLSEASNHVPEESPQ